MNDDQYAAAQAASLRDDWQFSRLFSRPAARPAFTALLGLRAEMRQVQASTGEAGIAAAKFEWWRGEIERGFTSRAQHPLARSIGRHLAAAGIAAEYCLELVDAAETEYEMHVPPNAHEFQLYLYRSGGVLAELLARLHGVSEHDALGAARTLGQLRRFIDLAKALHPMVKSGRWLFPWEWLLDKDIAQLLNEPESADTALHSLFAALDQQRVITRTGMEYVQLPPALALQWPLAQRDYRRLRETSASVLLQAEMQDNMLRRLWTAWRSARKSAKSER